MPVCHFTYLTWVNHAGSFSSTCLSTDICIFSSQKSSSNSKFIIDQVSYKQKLYAYDANVKNFHQLASICFRHMQVFVFWIGVLVCP